MTPDGSVVARELNYALTARMYYLDRKQIKCLLAHAGRLLPSMHGMPQNELRKTVLRYSGSIRDFILEETTSPALCCYDEMELFKGQRAEQDRLADPNCKGILPLSCARPLWHSGTNSGYNSTHGINDSLSFLSNNSNPI